MLKFDEATHIYTYNGVRVPSVTQVLSEIKTINIGDRRYKYNVITGDLVPAEIFENAGDFGDAVHKGSKFILEGTPLNWDGMDEKVAATLKVFDDFLTDYHVVPLALEKPRYSRIHGVAGTPDFYGRVNGEKALIDYKTGAFFPLVGPQVAGYEVLVREETAEREPIKRYSLKLGPKKYVLEPLAGIDDMGYFLARVYQHKVLTKIYPKYNR